MTTLRGGCSRRTLLQTLNEPFSAFDMSGTAFAGFHATPQKNVSMQQA
jgi:hypothetical protein